ncbi:PQQ-binding-like beta-propeller repeat protein [Kitasatospora sp. NPDC101176]|uniref:outer membrane protein assembly factor BamB family protein n=1 Tax=Kitasatospora sp. NPDC101176 TaxID=3364099 RepID=UPI0037F582DF
MQSPSTEEPARQSAWQWDGEADGGAHEAADVIGGGGDGPRPSRRRLLIGAGVLAAGGAAWAFGRTGADRTTPSPGPSRPPGPPPTALSGPQPVWTYRGPEPMTPERLVAPPKRPVFLSRAGLQVVDPATGSASRLVVVDPPESRSWPSDLSTRSKVLLGPEHAFTTAFEGHLDARHLTDPSADWSLPLPDGLQPGPELTGYADGVLYGFSWGGYREDGQIESRLFALRVADRSLLWSVRSGRIEQPVAPAVAGGRVACVRSLGNRAELVVRDTADGRELWTGPGDEDLRWCTAGPDRVYVPDGGGGVRALGSDGGRAWTHSPARGESWRAMPPVPDGPRVYVPRDDGLVTGHEAATGAVQWTCRLPFLLDRRSHPVLAGTTLFVPGPAVGGVCAVDTATGRLLWTFRDSGPGKDVWTVAADADRLYAGHDDVLHALPLH